MVLLVSFKPVISCSASGFEADTTGVSVFHVADNEFFHYVDFVEGNVEVEFVVNLHNHF